MDKPKKVEEPATKYIADDSTSSKKKAEAAPAIRYAKMDDVLRANAKLLQVHGKVLRKLAQ